MRNIIILFFLLLSASTLMAQTLYTRSDSVAITSDSVTLHSGHFRGIIQWQQSQNGHIWNDLEGKTGQILKVSKFSEGYYRAQITDASCLPAYSDTAVVVAFKTDNPMVIDPDEVLGTTFIERDDRIFSFISLPNTTIPVNTVFLENDKESDIRVVSGVTRNGDTLMVNTLPGKMEDLFVNRVFNLSTEIITPASPGTYSSNTALSKALTDNNGFIHPVEGIDLNSGNSNLLATGIAENHSFIYVSENLIGEKLYNKNGMELTITDGYFNMGAVLKSEFNFRQSKFKWYELPTGKLKSCSFYTDKEKTVTETKLILEAKTNGQVSVDETFVLKQDIYKHLFKYWVGEIPVWMYVKIDLMAKVKGDFSGTFSVTGGASGTIGVDLGSNYSNGEWMPFFNYSNTINMFDPIYDGHISYMSRYEVYPRIETYFYYSQCPFMEIVPFINESMELSVNSNYNSELSVGLDVRTGVIGNILGYGISDLDEEFKVEPETLYREPETLEIVNGNEQIGIPGGELGNPIVIKVLNSRNNPVSNVHVHFNPVFGSVNLTDPVTDGEGKVSVKWTLGNFEGGQTLEAFLKDGKDNKIDNSVVTIISEGIIRVPTVSTNPISNISEYSALCGGNVISNGGANVTARGVCWNTYGNPTIANSKTVNGIGTGIFTSGLNGLTNGTTYYVKAYATNSRGVGYGNEVSFRTGTFIDSRDGNVYQTVTIGSQTWMAENLAYLPYITSDFIWSETSECFYIYDNTTYGVLYNWPAAMNACPAGWHLPSDAEWDVLANSLGGREVAGGKLKSVTGWNSPNVGATNETNFTGLPGGGFSHGSYFNSGVRGYWWSSTEIDPTIVWTRNLFYNLTDLLRTYYFREVGYSVRCVRD